ncbi:MAG: YicC/YloC family endoribonuclease [Candidatus Omnitrophota bacterium]
MIKSMTGFGGSELSLKGRGKITVELRSTNHKFLEISLHLPEGSFALEEKIKKIIEGKVKRGRVACVVNILGQKSGSVEINTLLLKRYLDKINKVKKELGIQDSISFDSLIRLPGILALEEESLSVTGIWPALRVALMAALNNLSKSRKKEGIALQGYLKGQTEELKKRLSLIKSILRASLRERLKRFATDEERGAFLKDTDTTEEIDRLGFHIRNLQSKIKVNTSVGKEIDFIAQELQREANTLAAKTFDKAVSAQVLKVKSIIEKIREQAQNIE